MHKQEFIAEVKRMIKCTKKQAAKVFGVYLKHKLLKRDPYSGFSVKHGVYLEKNVLWNAINLYGDDYQPLDA